MHAGLRTRRTASGIKRMWREDGARCEAPRGRLTEQDQRINVSFALEDPEHGRYDPVELLDRVRRGVKPMGTLLVRRGRRDIHIHERVLRKAAAQLGLELRLVNAPHGVVWGVVFQGGMDLSRFYDPDAALAAYARAGIPLPPRVLTFQVPLETFARRLALEDFDAPVRFQVTGLCLGYPVEDTIRMVRALSRGWSSPLA